MKATLDARRATLIGIATAVGFLALIEIALRLAGFSREIAPVALRFGYPNPREIAGLFQPDPRLFWRLRPGSTFDAEAPVPINERGYRGPVPRADAPDALLRVAVCGDSVAFGSASAWPEILASRLAVRDPGRPVEVLDFGVPGYSIVQGLRQFEDEVAPLRPDVVLIAYGWNDHWLARAGVPDGDLRPPGRGRAALSLALSRLRIAQALRALLVPAGKPPGDVRRVPIEAYREHVASFAAEVREAGGVPIVVGLPSALAVDDLPAYLVDGGFTPSAEEAVADHARYLSAAREAAERAGARYLDAASRMGGDTSQFTRDRIHLSARGHETLAGLVEAEIR